MADECENLDAVLFMADCNTYFADSSLENEWDNTLQCFRRFCKLPWLAEKDIILVFLNIDKFPIEPLDGHVLRHSKPNDYAETATRGDIINRFCSLNEDDSREIYAICVENDTRAKNLDMFENAVQLILNKKTKSARESWNV